MLLDEGLVTKLHTAVVGAAAAWMLTPDLGSAEGCRIGILGMGVQAWFQLHYLAHVAECQNALVWGGSKDNVQKLIANMEEEGWNEM